MPITEEEKQELRAIICNELNLTGVEITDATLIRELPGIESMKVLRMIAKIERHFDLELSDDVVFNIGTFAELLQALNEARNESAS